MRQLNKTGKHVLSKDRRFVTTTFDSAASKKTLKLSEKMKKYNLEEDWKKWSTKGGMMPLSD